MFAARMPLRPLTSLVSDPIASPERESCHDREERPDMPCVEQLDNGHRQESSCDRPDEGVRSDDDCGEIRGQSPPDERYRLESDASDKKSDPEQPDQPALGQGGQVVVVSLLYERGLLCLETRLRGSRAGSEGASHLIEVEALDRSHP